MLVYVDVVRGSPVETVMRAIGSRKRRARVEARYPAGSAVLLGWDGGSRDEWAQVTLDGRWAPLPMALDPNRMGDPFGQRKVLPPFPEGAMAVVRYGTFCGKPATPVIYFAEAVRSAAGTEARQVEAVRFNPHYCGVCATTTSCKAVVRRSRADWRSIYRGRNAESRDMVAAQHRRDRNSGRCRCCGGRLAVLHARDVQELSLGSIAGEVRP